MEQIADVRFALPQVDPGDHRGVDPHTQWEVDKPVYRVSSWHQPDAPPGSRNST
jgi:hypothetical protein